MPADTTTPILGLLLQGTGNNNNTWGTNLNNSVITPIENAIKGVNSITGLTGGAYTLTQANAAYQTIGLNGTLTSDLTITVPSSGNRWVIYNGCSGAFSVLIKTAAGATHQLPVAVFSDVYCDGGNVYRTNLQEVGEYFFFAGSSVPNGALECNGASLLRTSYPDLFNAIGTLHGAVDGTHFTLPNATTSGMFLRSRSASNTVGTAQASQNLSHSHTFSGALAVGTLGMSGVDGTHTNTGTTNTIDRSLDHNHLVASPRNKSGGSGGGTAVQGIWNDAAFGSSTTVVSPGINSAPSSDALLNHLHTFTTDTSGGHGHTITGVPGIGSLATVADGGGEARPANITGILCVRY